MADAPIVRIFAAGERSRAQHFGIFPNHFAAYCPWRELDPAQD